MSAERIISELQRIHLNAVDPNLTGWVNWPHKQELYRVKFALDDMLKNTSTFADEEAWLQQQQLERDQKQVWKSLNEVQRMRK